MNLIKIPTKNIEGSNFMPIQLFVDYTDRNKVKKLGAKWSDYKKSWYLPIDKKENLDYSYKWLSKEQQECKFFIPYNNLYLYKTTIKCYKCSNEMEVICLGSIRYEDNYKVYYIYITLLSEEIVKLFNKYENIKYEKRYSFTEKKSYYMNICNNCNSHQGDYFMFFEHKSPFLNLSNDDIEEIKLNFNFDVPISSNLISSSNYCIMEYPENYFDGDYFDEDYFLIKKKIKEE